MNKIVFFSADTNNLRNDRICRLSLIVEENGTETFSKSWLINPETPFHKEKALQLGIDEEQIAEAPVFAEVWKEAQQYFETALIAGHNVYTTCSVFDRLFQHYDIDEAAFTYIDTMHKSGQLPYSPKSFGLSALCKSAGVETGTPEDPMASVRAIRDLYHVFDQNMPWNVYDEHTYWFGKTRHRPDQTRVEIALLDLDGILFGITSDGRIAPDELTAVENWYDEHAYQKNEPGLRVAYTILTHIFETGTIEDKDRYAIHNLAYRHAARTIFSPTVRLHILRGIISGILSDGKVNEDEIVTLETWMEQNRELSYFYPFSSLFDTVKAVMEDEKLDEEESEQLQQIFERFTDPLGARLSDGNISVKGKKVYLSGDFIIGTRSEVEKKITDFGGIIAEELSEDVDYLVVGSHGAVVWTDADYGEDVKAALAMQETGNPIQILGEAEVF